MTPQMHVDGIPLYIAGDGPETIIMIHGWPDTYRIWADQAVHFSARYRCVRFTLPGFDGSTGEGFTLAQVTEKIRRIAEAVSPDKPVILMIHDWGCIFGYQFAMQYPERVSRIVAIDIGDANSPEFERELSLPAKGMVAGYQLTLALAWKTGDFVGSRITRAVAWAMRGKAESRHIHASMNYPYAMRWLKALDGFDALRPVEPACPLFYAYGRKKPFQFHTKGWLERMRMRPGNRVQGFDCPHWVMVDCAGEFNAAVEDWLEGRD